MCRGCYRSLSRYVKIRSSTNGISYDKNLLLTCRNMGTLLYLVLSLYQTTNFWTRPNLKHLQTTIHMLVISLFGRAENIAGKGENAGYQHFLLFPPFSPSPTMFSKGFFPRVIKCRDYVIKSYLIEREKLLENIMRKKEKVLFLTMFSTLFGIIFNI